MAAIGVAVRRAVRGMLHADDVGTVSKLAEGLAKMMMVIIGATASDNVD